MEAQQKLKMNVNKIRSQIRRSQCILEAAQKQLNVAQQALDSATKVTVALKNELKKLEETALDIEMLRRDVQNDEAMEKALNDESMTDMEDMEETDVNSTNE